MKYEEGCTCGTMEKINFKLNYYFEKYKDMPFLNRKAFRAAFRRKYGKFEGLEELIIKIEKYQIKKFGSSIYDCFEKKTREERKYEQDKSTQRLRSRLGKK